MHWTDALEIIVARTRHERYRVLCADDHPDREAWRIRILAMAAEPEPAIPVSVALTLARRMRCCPFRSTDPGCGCSGGRCALRRGAIVSHRDCFDCLSRYGDA